MRNTYLISAVLTIFVTLTVTGCEDDRKKEVGEGNARISDTNTLTADLDASYKIQVRNPDKIESQKLANEWEWQIYTEGQLKAIETKLSNVVGNITRVLEISSHDGIVSQGDPNADYIVRDNAQAYLNSLRSFNVRRGAAAPRDNDH